MPAAASIKVAIIEDNRLVREALVAMLERTHGMDVVASDAADAAFFDEHRPDVVLLDSGLTDLDSFEVTLSIRRDAPFAKIIVMDLIPVHEEIAEFVNAGVSGFVLKDASFEDFVTTVRTVAGGGKVLPPTMTNSLFSQIAADHGVRSRVPLKDAVRMTRREHEVIGLIGEGLSNKEIAQRLNIATHTVKSHVRNVMEKLALHTRLQIAAYSHREGTAE